MDERTRNITKAIFKYIIINGYVLIIGLIAGTILGEENFNNLVGEPARDGISFWVGSYLLGVIVIIAAFFVIKIFEKIVNKKI